MGMDSMLQQSGVALGDRTAHPCVTSWRLGFPPLPVLANCLAARPTPVDSVEDPMADHKPRPASSSARPAAAWVALLCDPDYVIILAPDACAPVQPGPEQSPSGQTWIVPDTTLAAYQQSAACSAATAPMPAPGALARPQGILEGLARRGGAQPLGGPAPNQAPAVLEPKQAQRLAFGAAAGLVCGAAWAPSGAELAVACQRAVFIAAAVRTVDNGGAATCGAKFDVLGASQGLAAWQGIGAVAAAHGGDTSVAGLRARGLAAWQGGWGAAASGGNGQDAGRRSTEDSREGRAAVAGGPDGGGGAERLEVVLRIPLFFWPKARVPSCG